MITVASWGHVKSACMSCEKASETSGTTFRLSTPRQPSFPRSSITSNIKSVVEYEYTLFTLPTEARLSLSTRIAVNGQILRMEVDTGAAFLVNSQNTYQELFSTLPLQHSPVKFKTYSGESLLAFESINVVVSYEKQQMPLSLQVVGLDGPSLLGQNWLSELRLK